MNEGSKIFALKCNDRFDFLCISNTIQEFERKVDTAFWNWKGMQAKGSVATIDDFLSKFKKVIVMIEPY